MNEQVLRPRPVTIGAAEFFKRSRARLGFDVPPGLVDPNIIPRTGDSGNDRMLEIVAQEQPVRPAAVLIPVVDHLEPTVLLTQRSPHLSSHAGQISFPGGKIDATDESPLDAALREAEEEVGLSASSSSRSAISISTAPRSDFASCRRSPGSSRAFGSRSMNPKWSMPSRCRWRS